MLYNKKKFSLLIIILINFFSAFSSTTPWIIPSVPYALAYYLLKTPPSQEASQTEDEQIKKIIQSLSLPVLPTMHIRISKKTNDVIATESSLICPNQSLDLIQTNPALFGAMTSRALYITKTSDYKNRTATLLAIPTAIQTTALAAIYAIKQCKPRPIIRTCASSGIAGAAALVSILFAQLFHRYQNICADKSLSVKPELAHAYIDYLKEQHATKETHKHAYHLSPLLYEIFNTSPLLSKRAQWLEKATQKVEQKQQSGQPIIFKQPPSFLPAIMVLIKKKLGYK